jgi:hypothetical protein
MDIGYFFQNFHTSLVLLMGPRMICGWYNKIGTKLVLPQVPTRLVLVYGWYCLRLLRVLATSVDSLIG